METEQIEQVYKEQIRSNKTRLLVTLAILVAFLGGVSVSVYKQYQQYRSLPITPQNQTQFKGNEFVSLWEELANQTVPIQSPAPVTFGGDLGKIEPFEQGIPSN